MRVTLTGATGRIGGALVAALRDRGDDVTVLSRNPDAARAALGGVEAVAWRPEDEPPPAGAPPGRARAGGGAHGARRRRAHGRRGRRPALERRREAPDPPVARARHAQSGGRAP